MSPLLVGAQRSRDDGADDPTKTHRDRLVTGATAVRGQIGQVKKTMNRLWGRLLEVPAAAPTRASGRSAPRLRDYELYKTLPLLALHVGAVAAFFVGAGWQVWVVGLVLFWVRMFAVTGGYHRYFSHRTYKTGRVRQFLLAFLAQTSSQKGVLWWAAHHRDHHKFSDTERDVHSPKRCGFWHAHIGWLYDHTAATDYNRVKDLARYPELVILNKLWWVPPVALAVSVTAIWGWPGLLVGFMLSTVLLWHATFTVNSLAHVWGKRRYETADTSRNNWVLALLTMGEGWHNNHHYFMGSTRQGFRWWEIDATYYVLEVMSWVGLVSDLKKPPARVRIRDSARSHAGQDRDGRQTATFRDGGVGARRAA